MRNLYVDFDGVIADTITELNGHVASFGIDFKTSDFETIHQIFANYDWHGLLDRVMILNNAFDELKKIVASDEFNVSILSHINSYEEGVAKVNYIQKHISGLTIILVPKKLSKTKMVNSKDAILIDDYAGNLREWEKAGGIGVLYSQILENKGYPVLNKLSDVLELV